MNQLALPAPHVIWTAEGSPCRAPGCTLPMRGLLNTRWRILGERRGPQGRWECGRGHMGWIWPGECELILPPGPTIAPPRDTAR